LVLIDEFGKGTADGDGVGLFAALISWLAKNGAPRTIAITHFHEIYTKKLIDHDAVKWWSMSVHYGEESNTQFECFLYRLEYGPCTQSHGLYCAQLAGLPPLIIERGNILGGKIFMYSY
jgi:DNA mismatch repair ATPase MutS